MNASQVPMEDISLETFQHVLNVNITAPFLCTREAFKVFKSQSPPGGRIINNGSLSAHTPRPFSVPYTTSKHAITGLTKCTALDGRAHNITCTQIDIGEISCQSISSTDLSFPGRKCPYRYGCSPSKRHTSTRWKHCSGKHNGCKACRRHYCTHRRATDRCHGSTNDHYVRASIRYNPTEQN